MLVERSEIPIGYPPPLSGAERHALAADRLIFFWAMAPIAVKYVARTDTCRAVSQIDLLTVAYIALWRLVAYPHGPHPWLPHTNRVLEGELAARLPRVASRIDPLDALKVIEALCAQVERLHPALAAFGVPIPDEMPDEVARLTALAGDL
jgi:hypothetical protein